MRGGAKGSFSTGPLAPGPLDEFISSPAYFLQDDRVSPAAADSTDAAGPTRAVYE
jgi:hypothetical protein